MKLFFASLSLSFVLVACTGTNPQPPAASNSPTAKNPANPSKPNEVKIEKITDLKNTVILISIDAFRHDYIDKWNVPMLQALARNGLRANVLNPVFPSLTFPNHYTQVTGLLPEHHGIVANNMRDPVIPDRFVLSDARITDDPRWWGGEPVWVTAELQGQKAATEFWPGSSAPIKNVRPSYWNEFDGNVTPSNRVKQVLSWIDLPVQSRPTLLTLYFDAVDTAGHQFGPSAPEVGAAATLVDSAIAELYNGLKDRGISNEVNLIFVSDHGMADIVPNQVLALNSVIDLKTVEVQGGGSLVHIFPNDPAETTNVLTKLKQLSPHIQVYAKSEIPARFNYQDNPRIAPIVMMADEGWYVVNEPRQVNKGTHGYDNDLNDMKAFFVAVGPAFAAGTRIPSFNTLDVYDLVCDVLGLTPANNDGNAAAALAALSPSFRDKVKIKVPTLAR